MTCENCKKKIEQEKKSKEFQQALGKFLEEFRDQEINSVDIAYTLIQEAKIEMCCAFPCYYHMLGLLTDILNYKLPEMWEEMSPDTNVEED